MVDLSTLKRLLAESSPGEWKCEKCGAGESCWCRWISSSVVPEGVAPAGTLSVTDAALIVAMREALPGLIAEVEASRWQPIETAPRDGTRVLGYGPAWSAPTVAWCYGAGYLWGSAYGGGYAPGEITHWMPLPAAPGAQESRKAQCLDGARPCEHCGGSGSVWVAPGESDCCPRTGCEGGSIVVCSTCQQDEDDCGCSAAPVCGAGQQ